MSSEPSSGGAPAPGEDPIMAEEDSQPSELDMGMMASVDESPDFLPPFANEANKKLDREIKAKEKVLEEHSEQLDENVDRINAMTEHLKSVEQEVLYTQARCMSKKQEKETENHLRQLSDRECGRLKEEIAKSNRHHKELEDKLTELKKAIYSVTEKMDQFKLLMNWNQEELEQWALAARQKEEDNLSLQKYMRADEVRIKELSLHVQKISNAVSRKKDELDSEVTETQAAQIMLDKTAEDFRQLHNERQELTRQWEEAMEAMKKRDEAIQKTSELFAERRRVLKQVQSRLDASARFLESEIVNNRELNVRLALTERQVGKQREKLRLETSSVTEAHDEVELVKATLNNTAAQLSKRQAENKGLKEELEKKAQQVDVLHIKLETTKDRLDGDLDELTRLNDKSQALLKRQLREEVRLQELEREKHGLRDKIFKTGQELFGLRTTERDLIAEIAGTQSQNKNMEAKINQLDAQISRQQELLYKADFQIQQLERKVARASGERSDDEKRVLNQKISVLEEQLEGVQHDHGMLDNQVKTASDTLRHATRTQKQLEGDSNELNSKIDELKLECDTTHRVVKNALKLKEDKLVEADVLRLEVKKRARALVEATSEVYGLENRKEQLGFSLEEQKSQAEIHKDTLLAQLKIIQEDIHRLTLELSEKQLKITKLNAKYDVLAGKMKSADEPEGVDSDKSQAYYVIKAAQEREELQREGDALDSEISKAEKEVAALQATMAKIMEKNVAYRNSFRSVDEREVAGIMETLKQQLDIAFDRMKLLQTQEEDLRTDIDQINEQLAKIKYESDQKLQTIETKLTKNREKEAKSMGDQIEREKRAATRLSKILSEFSAERHTLLKEDISLRSMREINNNAFNELENIASNFPHANILDFLNDEGFQLPRGRSLPGSRRPSDSGSRPASRASSMQQPPRSSASLQTVQFKL